MRQQFMTQLRMGTGAYCAERLRITLADGRGRTAHRPDGSVEYRESAEQKRHAGISYNAYASELRYRLGKGQTRVVSLDRC